MNKKSVIIICSAVLVIALVVGCVIYLNTNSKYEISFEVDGSTLSDTQWIIKNGKIQQPTTPVKEGYRFLGWYVDDELFDFDTEVTGAIKLVAKWLPVATKEIEENVLIEFDTDGGTEVLPIEIEKGKTVTKPIDPTKEGYTFVAWQLDSADYNFATIVTEDIILTATWSKIEEKPTPQTPTTISVNKIALSVTTMAMKTGETSTITATVTPTNATNKAVAWSTSNKSIATVDNNGKITAVSAGSAVITAKAGSKTATCTVTVSAKTVDVTGVSLSKTTLSLETEEMETITATVTPTNATNKTVTWTTSDENIATVDSNGKITAVSVGSAVITAKAGNKTATCTVTVSAKTVDVTGVRLSVATLNLNGGEIATIVATVAPTNATNKTVTWTTSNSNIATVDSNGKVTAVSAGIAIITARAGEKTATCIVNVVTYSVEWEEVASSSVGQYTLFIKSSNNVHVAGKVEITSTSGKKTIVDVPTTGIMYVKAAITNAVIKSID